MAVIINGTAGADQLFGNASDEVIHGLGGNDTIYGYDGEDQLFGDDGDDEITLGGNGMRAGIFAPVFTGTVFGDGGAGNDTLLVFTNASNVTALGGAGNDMISVRGIGGVTVDAGSGDDVVNVQTVGTLAITLGAGNDVVRFDNTSLATGYAITIADYTQNQDRISLDASGLLTGYNGDNPFTSGHLRLVQSGADTLLQIDRDGAAGTASTFQTLIRLQNVQAGTIADIDLYPVTGGGRIVRGTDGPDMLSGSTVYGGGGNDTITGTFGVDVLHGDDGNDTITGVSGSDKMYGDAGNDLLTIGLIAYSYTDEVLLDGGTGDDFLFFGNSPVRGEDIAAGYPRSTRAILNGGEGNDILVLWGSGGGVADAGAGNDYVSLGGTGYYSNVVPAVQRVTLGAGADVVSIDGPYGTTPHVITDFSPAEDRIVLDETALFRDRIVPGLPAYLRRTSDAFGEGYLRLVASGNDTILQIDQNGGGNEWSDLLRLQNVAPSAITEIGGFKVGGGTVDFTVTQQSAFPLTDASIQAPRVVLHGGGGNDTITGSAGLDVLSGEGGNDTIRGLGGNDTLSGGFGDNLIYGGDGNDYIAGQGDHDRLYGEAGDDVIDFSPLIPYGAFTDTVLLDGGDGNDRLSVGANNAASTFLGGAGNDTITVNGFARSTVDAGTGDDSVTMSNPFTRVTLGDGRDVLTLRAFQTTPLSQSATVTDFLPGTDKLVFSTTEYLPGWSGSGNPFALGFLWLLQDGADVVLRRDPDGGGNTYYELVRFANTALASFSAADFSGFDITAAPLVAPLQGTAGNDLLIGSTLVNTILGGAGNDRIIGLAGADILTGGAGNDTFNDTAADHDGDTITDFSVGDRINFSDAIQDGFVFSVSGSTLTYTGGTLTLTGGVPTGYRINAVSGVLGGVDLVLVAAPIKAAQNDFNGDGRSDIVWRNDNGAFTDWLARPNGSFALNDAAAYTTVPLAWKVAGVGDFNGDGRADVLWRNDNGALTDWLGQSNGAFALNDVAAYAQVSLDWKVAGVGDFNGDGRADVLWRNDNGALTDWLGQANGGFAINNAAYTTAPTSWKVAGIGDFNGDGRDDILWRNDNGALTDWLGQANGSFTLNDAAAYTTVPLAWKVAGVGDFNGDGRDDILWRNDNGALTDWLGQANGGFAINAAAYAEAPTSWKIANVGDYNGDGRDDILWRNDNGALTDWLGQSNGGFGFNDAAYTVVPTAWKVADTRPLLGAPATGSAEGGFGADHVFAPLHLGLGIEIIA